MLIYASQYNRIRRNLVGSNWVGLSLNNKLRVIEKHRWFLGNLLCFGPVKCYNEIIIMHEGLLAGLHEIRAV